MFRPPAWVDEQIEYRLGELGTIGVAEMGGRSEKRMGYNISDSR